MSYDRMKKREAELKAEVDRWLAAAEAADAEEDKLYGDKRGDEMPDWVADKQRRLEKIREAKAELEAQAKAAAAEETRRREEAEKKRIAEGRKKNGKPPTPPKPEPEGKTQRNFTDPESRALLTKDGSIHGYNAQAAVDAEAQIIVAARPTSAPWPIAGSALTSQRVGPSTPPRPNESAAARSPRPCGTS
jgi:hypothetical protein